MKKLLSLLLTVCLLAGALSLTASAAEKQVTINVLILRLIRNRLTSGTGSGFLSKIISLSTCASLPDSRIDNAINQVGD